jgi:hypothetical protein
MCFFCLWLSTCFLTLVATLQESSFVTLAPGVEELPGLPYCANAGEAVRSAVINIPGTVNFMLLSIARPSSTLAVPSSILPWIAEINPAVSRSAIGPRSNGVNPTS